MFGCSTEQVEKLLPYVVPDEETTPGVATWYTSVCGECPAGCGVWVRTREGRVVKGVKFVEIRDAGDPAEAARAYSEQGADELVMLDITATLESRETRREWIKAVAEAATV